MMTESCKVTFLGHSGFLLETKEHYLLFDYWHGEIPELAYEKTLYVFVSHSHHDHFNKDIFNLENRCCEVNYILSHDIRDEDSNWKKAKNVIFMNAHEQRQIGDCYVETLLSTDMGVAFLLEVDSMQIYHAGDLHWWEWPGEPEEENQAYIHKYLEEIKKLEGRKIDIAFVVLDPRQEEAGGRGMDAFLSRVGAKYVFPMHLWEEYDLIASYKASNQRKYITSQIMEIRASGQEFII